MGVLADLLDHVLAQVEGREHGVAVAAVDAGGFDVLHDPDDAHHLPVADGVGLGLDGAVQEVVDQDLVVGHHAEDVEHLLLQLLLVDHDLHLLAAEHVAGPHQQREAELARQGDGLLGIVHRAELRVGDPQVAQQAAEPLAVLGHVQRLVAGTDHGNAVTVQLLGQLQGGLPAQLHDHALGLLVLDDVVDVLPEDRLEVELVGRVEVRAHGLRVAVDHDGLVALLLGRQHAVHAAVVELDALPDAVGTAAEHDDLLLVAALALVLLLEGAVVVGRAGREFSGAGVHQLVHPADAELLAPLVHLALQAAQQVRDLPVGVALLLGLEEQVLGQRPERVPLDLLLGEDQVLDLLQEPEVDAGALVDGLEGDAGLDGVVDVEEPVPAGVAQALEQHVRVGDLAAVGAQAVAADLEALAGLLQRLLEAAADAHGLAHALHLHAQPPVAALELVEVPARHLHDHVVQGGLEEGAGASDRVLQLVQPVADGELAGDLGDGVAGGLAGQRRAAAHPRVDLDGVDLLLLVRAHRELHVAAAGEIPDGAHHLDGHRPHLLVRAVAQGHGRRHGDAVAGVYAHRIEVLDAADDGDVVVLVAQQLQLVLLPPEQGLVDHDLVDGADLQAVLQQLVELLGVLHEGRPRPAQGVAGADHQGEAELLRHLFAFQEAGDGAAGRHGHADAFHQLAEALTVLGDVDGLGIHPDHAHPVLFPDAELLALDGQVQRGLSAHGGQHGVDLVLLQDGLDALGLQRAQVHVVGRDRVGHDGGRVAVDQRDLDAFVAEGAAGLAAGVIELAGLSDHDRSRPDDQDRLDAGVFRHVRRISGSRRYRLGPAPGHRCGKRPPIVENAEANHLCRA